MLDEASVQFLFDRAREYLYARQALCQERFQMGRFRLWQVDAETSTLVFGSGSGKKVSASFDE
ncbi:MAG: hypothetical protein JWP27_28, partial [Flaviaesturariibacter sp.]|nr:hypothetical protein [Flaviaesturariibacter sp.]